MNKERKINSISQGDLNLSLESLFVNSPIKYLIKLTRYEEFYKDAIFSIFGLIIKNELKLGDKTYDVIERISAYLNSIGIDEDFEYDPERLISVIDFLVTNHPYLKEKLISIDDIITALAKKVYYEKYKEKKGISVTSKIDEDQLLTKTEYTKEMITNVRKFCHFKEKMMPKVYKTRLKRPEEVMISDLKQTKKYGDNK